MIVKFKPTGQLGELPDNEFDPNLYEPVGGNTAPVSKPAQNSLPPITSPSASVAKKPGFLEVLYEATAAPFVGTGKHIAGAAFEAYRAGKQALGVYLF